MKKIIFGLMILSLLVVGCGENAYSSQPIGGEKVVEVSYNDVYVTMNPEITQSWIRCYDNNELNITQINYTFVKVADYTTEYITHENSRYRIKFPRFRQIYKFMDNEQLINYLNSSEQRMSGRAECYGRLDVKVNARLFDEGYSDLKTLYSHQSFDVRCRLMNEWECEFVWDGNSRRDDEFPYELVYDIEQDLKEQVVR